MRKIMTLNIGKEDFKQEYLKILVQKYSEVPENCTPMQKYKALAQYVYSLQSGIRSETIHRNSDNKPKKVYYFSMEFLIGRLLENYLINLGIRDIVDEGLKELGEDLNALCELEPDPGLGNGGLGRLAACFLDSMASVGISGVGMGLRYSYGLFRQKIESGYQFEEPDAWLKDGYPWELIMPEQAIEVHFDGTIEREFRDGKLLFHHKGYEAVKAIPYHIPIIGYGGEISNLLKLWKAAPMEDTIDLEAFNKGDYERADRVRNEAEAITTILYPDDTLEAGRILRFKQEYFLVSAGIQSIFRDYRSRYGEDAWHEFPDHVSIHTNDTHPAMCIPEMMRILLDKIGMEWDEAWDITTRTISFTNHTILPEAMEKWPKEMMKTLVPRILMIIEEIDRRWSATLTAGEGHWRDAHSETAVIWKGDVRMADLSIIGSHSVNGVSSIHSNILANSVFKDFYRINPEKFNNKTNGVSQRRFLIQANPLLSSLIDETIGQEWRSDMMQLKRLNDFAGDSSFLEKLGHVKRENKARLARYISEKNHIAVDPDSLFDVQVKRIHAYKRQLLNAFKVLDIYFRLKENPDLEIGNCTFIFGGKAATGYAFAKEVIKFICSVADLVNSDPVIRERIKVVFIENFCLSNAQLIYPATDISEQISTAGMEASGTGNMKFMMNGAILLGTLDGSNIEISEQVGMENVKIFGLTTEEIQDIRNRGSYNSRELISSDSRIGRLIDCLVDGTLDESGIKFWKVYDAMVTQNDDFFVLKDFSAYMSAWEDLEDIYRGDRERWRLMSLRNTANSGYFSSDRTIREYAEEIWHIDC